MVAIRRINPEDGFVRIFNDLKTQVNSYGTRPSGDIVIRETLTTTDPNTGVSLILGRLPDGSTGIQEFVNDITPPGKPTAPITTPVLGAVAVQWDGLQIGGDPQPRDYDRTEVKYRKSGTIETWALGGVFYGTNTLVVPNLNPAEVYDFQLVSFDKNGNASLPSDTVTGTASTIMDNSDVSEAIEEVRSEAVQATKLSGEAQSTAKSAQAIANKAAEEVASAVAGASRTIFSHLAPTDLADRSDSNVWVDTSGTPPKNTPNRWNGSAWVAVTDQTALDAAATAAKAEASAKASAASAAAAAIAAGEAQTAADGKSRIWHLSAAPAGTAHSIGDTWFNTSNGNEPNRWDGATWVSIRDTAIAAAKRDAISAAATEAQRVADAALEAAKTDATTKVATKNKTWSQASRPALTGNVTGDTWIDTSTAGGNKPYTWNGSAWVSVQDAAIATAQGAATTALTAANGKNKIIFSTSDASGTTGYTAGDFWMKRNSTTGVVIGQWEFTVSGTWEKRTVGEEVIGNLSAGKITSGTVSADRIGANTISVEKLLVTSTDNLVYDANHADRTGAAWTTGYSGAYAWDETGGRGGTPAFKITLSAAQQGRYNASNTPVTGGSSYRVLAWVFSTTEIPAQGLAVYARQRTTLGGTAYSTVSVTNKTPIPANEWFPFTSMLTLREDAVSVSFGVYSQAVHTTGTLWVDYLSATRAANAELLVDGAIKAGSAIIANGAIGTAHIGDAQITNAKINDLNASKMTAGTVAADRLDASIIRGKVIDADNINATDILASNSITAASGIIGSIDAGKISVGTLDAARIGAQTLTADKVIIGQGINLITDPSFTSAQSNTIRASKSTGTWTFDVDSGTKFNRAVTTTATTNNAFMFGLVARSAANAANMIPVTPGERYLLRASVYTDISAGVRWNVETVNADGSVGYVAASPTNTAVGRRPIEYEYVVPNGVVAFSPVLACLTTGVTWVVDAGAMVARKTEGNLLVSGAIDGQTITGALFQSRREAGLGIKLSDTQLVSYNANKQETFRIDGATGNVSLTGTIKSGSSIEGAAITGASISGATITGGIVQTQVTGKKITIQNQNYGSDIRFYSPDNGTYAQMLYGTTEENSGGTAGSDMLTIKGDQTGRAYMTLHGSGGITIDSTESAHIQGTQSVELLTSSDNSNAPIMADGKMLSLMFNHFQLENQLAPCNSLWGPGKPLFNAGWSSVQGSARDVNGSVITRTALNRGTSAAGTTPYMSTFADNDMLTFNFGGLYAINWTLITGTPHPMAAYAWIGRSNDNRIAGMDFKGSLANISHPCIRIYAGEKIKFKFSVNNGNANCYVTHEIQVTRVG